MIELNLAAKKQRPAHNPYCYSKAGEWVVYDDVQAYDEAMVKQQLDHMVEYYIKNVLDKKNIYKVFVTNV